MVGWWVGTLVGRVCWWVVWLVGGFVEGPFWLARGFVGGLAHLIGWLVFMSPVPSPRSQRSESPASACSFHSKPTASPAQSNAAHVGSDKTFRSGSSASPPAANSACSFDPSKLTERQQVQLALKLSAETNAVWPSAGVEERQVRPCGRLFGWLGGWLVGCVCWFAGLVGLGDWLIGWRG